LGARGEAGRKSGMMATLRRYLIAGLVVWVPLAITIWVLSLLVELMDQSLLIVPPQFRSDALLGFHLPGLGIVLTLAILLFTGAVAANFFGKRLLLFWESLLGQEMSSNSGGLLVWPAKFLILAGFTLLLLQAVSEVIKRIAVLAGLITDPEPVAVHGHAPSDTAAAGGHNE